jgi:hypothetical protein
MASIYEFPPLQVLPSKAELERCKTNMHVLEEERKLKEAQAALDKVEAAIKAKADLWRRYTLYIKKSVLCEEENLVVPPSLVHIGGLFAKKSAIDKKYKLSEYLIVFEKCEHIYAPVIGSYQEKLCQKQSYTPGICYFSSGCQFCAKTMRTPCHPVPSFSPIYVAELEYQDGTSLRSRATILGHTVATEMNLPLTDDFLKCYEAFYAFLVQEKLYLDFSSFYEVVTKLKTPTEVVAAFSAKLSAYSTRPAYVEDFAIPKV